jgi:hypothetical protein
MENFSLLAFLQSILTTVLSYGGGVIPVFVIGWLVDCVLAVVPQFKPFREVVIQWVKKKLEDIRLERAKAVVMTTGEQYRNESLEEARHIGSLSVDRQKTLKEIRNVNAVGELLERGVVKTPEAASKLVDAAVAKLKTEGVNP